MFNFLKKRNFNTIIVPTGFTSFIDSKKNPTAMACLNLISGSIASMPLDIFYGKNKAVNHYLYPLLKSEPNSEETIDLFLKLITKDYYDGNIFIYIYRDENGIPFSLFRIDPNTVTVKRGLDNKKIFTIKNKTYDFTQILHIPSHIGYDGTVGMSIFKYAQSTFDLTKKIEEYLINGFDNSLGKRLVVDLSSALPNATDEQIELLKAKIISANTGSGNSGKPLFKNNKISYEMLDASGNDNKAAQIVELRDMQDKEICRIFGVPINFISPDKYQSEIESIYSLYVDNAVKPVAQALEQGLKKILFPAERLDYTIKFNYNSIMKTSLADRIATYTEQLSSGILTINEVRAKEDLMPIDGGDFNILNGGNFFVVTRENINAYMISSKIKAEEHFPLGDDKK